MSPELMPIDLETPAGLALLGAVAAKNGQQIARIALLPKRLFLLRAPDAPGLWFVGGEIEPGLVAHCSDVSQSISLAGSGINLEDAFTSCVAEGVERLSVLEGPAAVIIAATFKDMRSGLQTATAELIDRLCAERGAIGSSNLRWCTARTLATDAPMPVPADWCYRRVAVGAAAIPGAASSTGVAAGRNRADAASRALLELIERDAVALWWLGGVRGTAPSIEDPALAATLDLVGTLRQDHRARRTWLLDITTDLAVPVIAALSVRADGRGLAAGFAARLSRAEAATAAVLELCQSELAVHLVEQRELERDSNELFATDRRILERSRRIDASACRLLHPAGPTSAVEDRDQSAPTGDDRLAALRARLTEAGLDGALFDLSRPELELTVMRAIVPALQPMPSGLSFSRLDAVRRRTGGGDADTLGVSLF